MSDDVQQVLRSQEFFRLKQTLVNQGDIFELEESAKAIYIGPDSDIAEVQITYYNPDAPLNLETAIVAVNGPFVGRVDALNATKVASTGQPARILVAANDIVSNSYASPDSLALRSFNVPAVIDLMVALKGLPAIPEVRSDRTLRFNQVPYDTDPSGGGDDGSTDLIVPIYGRRMATVDVISKNPDVDITVSLVNLLPGADTVPRQLGTITIPGSAPARSRSGVVVYRASDAARIGAFDAGSGEYNESDQPPGPTQAIAGVPRGMADLLLVNIKQTNAGGNTTRFVDVFIKVCDRED